MGLARAIAAGMLGAVLTVIVYVTAVIAFGVSRQPPPMVGVDVHSGSGYLVAFRVSATLLLVAVAVGFVAGFAWVRRWQRRKTAI